PHPRPPPGARPPPPARPPVTPRGGRPGTASASAHTNRARHGRGTVASRANSCSLRSSWVTPRRAERTPGKPSSAATSSPLSSPRAGSPAAVQAASAFRGALAASLSAPSSTAVSMLSRSRPHPARSSRYSVSLPGLPDAIRSRGVVVRCRSAKRGDCPLLVGDQLTNPFRRESQQGVQVLAAEGFLLGGGLQLDEAAVVRHDHVHVRVGEKVLGVVEVEPGLTVNDADADCGYEAPDRVAVEHARLLHPLDRLIHGHECPGNRRGAGAAIGLQHVPL